MASEEDLSSKCFQKILCFKHCDNGGHASCFKIPRLCHYCKECLDSSTFSVPPFSLPSPFIFATNEYGVHKELPCSLLIKPTNGTFLTTYKSGDDLHIGISDSQGKIFSFDEDGITESKFWDCCLLLEITKAKDDAFSRKWDAALHHHTTRPNWQKHLYDIESHNCFSFVLEFLNTFSKYKHDKEEFCNQYIIPLTRRAADYIAIYRQVMKDGIHLH